MMKNVTQNNVTQINVNFIRKIRTLLLLIVNYGIISNSEIVFKLTKMFSTSQFIGISYHSFRITHAKIITRDREWMNSCFLSKSNYSTNAVDHQMNKTTINGRNENNQFFVLCLHTLLVSLLYLSTAILFSQHVNHMSPSRLI